jgi:hypothetical protein
MIVFLNRSDPVLSGPVFPRRRGIKGNCYEIHWFRKISLLNNKIPVAHAYRKGSFPLHFIEFYYEPRRQADVECIESVTSK